MTLPFSSSFPSMYKNGLNFTSCTLLIFLHLKSDWGGTFNHNHEQELLVQNDELRKGDFLISNNKEYKAVFQDDGNFVIYGWKPVWASDTCGSDVFRLCMQADCNLVMYNKANGPKWQTNSHKSGDCNMCRLHLTNDGKLVVYKESDEIWSSANSRGMK